MALYGSRRDASFVRSVNKEVVSKHVDTEVEVYKISAEHTQENIYNESKRKVYYDPIVVPAMIDRDVHQIINNSDMLDFSRNASFAFLRDTLKDLNLFIEEGDVILWDNEYYELKNVYDDQLWAGRNPDTLLGYIREEILEFGYSVSVVGIGHTIRENNLNLVSTRTNTTNRRRQNLYDNI